MKSRLDIFIPITLGAANGMSLFKIIEGQYIYSIFLICSILAIYARLRNINLEYREKMLNLIERRFR